LKRIAN